MNKILQLSFFALLFIIGFGFSGNNSAEAQTSPIQCVFISDYILSGKQNNQFDVLKLQAYLSGVEKIEVPINGVFDEVTRLGVKVYQERYRSETLAPWSLTQGTGEVNITTKNKINEWFCNRDIALTVTELETMMNILSKKVEILKLGTNQGQGINSSVIGQGVQNNPILNLERGIISSTSTTIFDEAPIVATATTLSIMKGWLGNRTTVLMLIVILILILGYLGYQLFGRTSGNNEGDNSK